MAKTDKSDKIDEVEIPFHGKTFKIPKDRDDWPTAAFIALAEGNTYKVLQEVLGVEQWAQLQLIGSTRRNANEFAAVFGKVAAAECIN